MRRGPIAVGDAVATGAGRLAAKWVIHAAVMGHDLQTDANLIARATSSTLELADHLSARSLALPAFGTGVGGFPIYACASIMVGQVRAYLVGRKHSGLRKVVFCAYDDVGAAAFKNALCGTTRLRLRRRAAAPGPGSAVSAHPRRSGDERRRPCST